MKTKCLYTAAKVPHCPLHESTFVKENCMLREKMSVFTQVSCKKLNPLPLPEFAFKGKGACIKLCHSQ